MTRPPLSWLLRHWFAAFFVTLLLTQLFLILFTDPLPPSQATGLAFPPPGDMSPEWGAEPE